MTYKDTLFFVGKCLTINHEEHNRIDVEKELKAGLVNWDNVVKVSTSHYVFPALYCNLKRANFLDYLPNDLVEYMQHITDLNRERNEQIIEQAKEINELLLENNITPIFLKGTGNLLSGLYNDIAERMVGDIDFLVSYSDYDKVINIFLENGYSSVIKIDNVLPPDKHFPRIHKENRIAAVEIHKEMVKRPYAKLFNYGYVKDNILSKNNISVLSFQDQLKLSIIAKQVNDDGQFFNDISLRNAYDVFLLSHKTDTIKSIHSLDKQLKIPLNNFLAITKLVLNSESVKFIHNDSSQKYIEKFLYLTNNKIIREKHHRFLKKRLFISSRLSIILKSFYKKDYFYWFMKRLFQGKP